MYLETATLCIEIYFCYWGVSGFIFILKIYLDDSLELGIITSVFYCSGWSAVNPQMYQEAQLSVMPT